VDVDTGQIGGPSAGTMMALAIYDRLTPGDLTGGHRVAGTGTIDSCSGEVGPIGGIREKVAAAQAGGMQIFLTPAADAADARKASDGMKIVAIKSFDDAVDYLEGLSS
jgi:PDZ domain-containing protein